MIVRTVIITKYDDRKESIRSLFSFDEDHNGNNGVEYVKDYILKEGYKNNLDYWIDTYIKEENSMYAILNSILAEYKEDDYYTDMEVEVQVKDESYFCVVCATTAD